jgi:hypothetical protein
VGITVFLDSTHLVVSIILQAKNKLNLTNQLQRSKSAIQVFLNQTTLRIKIVMGHQFKLWRIAMAHIVQLTIQVSRVLRNLFSLSWRRRRSMI